MADESGVDFEEKHMTKVAIPRVIKSAIAAGAFLSLAGCMYGGTGYYGDGYVNNSSYACDPYAPFDDYYACDYGYGFANIGYGGGWYDQYYYPGYGIYIFDRGGRRHAMRNDHRRYWARQRAEYGGHHARDRSRYPAQRTERRDQRYQSRDGIRDQRRGNYRDNSGDLTDPGTRPRSRATRPDRTDQARPVRNRGNQTGQPDRRPTRAVERPQARPQPATRPATTNRAPRPDGPRAAPRATREERRSVNDD